jgi:hypothetical protein
LPDGQSLDLLTVRRVPAGTSPAKIIMPSPGTIASPNTIARLNPSIMPSPRHAPVQSGSHLAGGGLRLGNWCEPPSCGLRLSRWLVIRAPRLFDRRSLGKAPARRPAHRFWREHRRAVCDTAFDGPRCDVLQSRQPAADLLTVAGYDQKSLPAPVRRKIATPRGGRWSAAQPLPSQATAIGWTLRTAPKAVRTRPMAARIKSLYISVPLLHGSTIESCAS